MFVDEEHLDLMVHETYRYALEKLSKIKSMDNKGEKRRLQRTEIILESANFKDVKIRVLLVE